jgi:hypothetical protein
MQQKYLLFGMIVLTSVILIGCMKEEIKLQDNISVQENISEQVEEDIPKFNISIYLVDGRLYKNAEIIDMVLPIDSEQKACELWEKADIGLCRNCWCNVTDEGLYWSFENWFKCLDSFLGCGGGCKGMIIKSNGNIDELNCVAIT